MTSDQKDQPPEQPQVLTGQVPVPSVPVARNPDGSIKETDDDDPDRTAG